MAHAHRQAALYLDHDWMTELGKDSQSTGHP